MDGMAREASFTELSQRMQFLSEHGHQTKTEPGVDVANPSSQLGQQNPIQESNLMDFLQPPFSARAESSESESSIQTNASLPADVHMSEQNCTPLGWNLRGSTNSTIPSCYPSENIMTQLSDHPLPPMRHRRAFSDNPIRGYHTNNTYKHLEAFKEISAMSDGLPESNTSANQSTDSALLFNLLNGSGESTPIDEETDADIDISVGHHYRSLSVDDGLLSKMRSPQSPDMQNLYGHSGSRGSHKEELTKQALEEMDDEDAVRRVLATKKIQDVGTMDPKRAKRILANRQSAARSKERKTRYISELEEKVSFYEKQSNTLKTTLSLLQKETSSLAEVNEEMNKKLQMMDKLFRQREVENKRLQNELEVLRQITQLSLQSNNNNNNNNNNNHHHTLSSLSALSSIPSLSSLSLSSLSSISSLPSLSLSSLSTLSSTSISPSRTLNSPLSPPSPSPTLEQQILSLLQIYPHNSMLLQHLQQLQHMHQQNGNGNHTISSDNDNINSHNNHNNIPNHNQPLNISQLHQQQRHQQQLKQSIQEHQQDHNMTDMQLYGLHLSSQSGVNDLCSRRGYGIGDRTSNATQFNLLNDNSRQ